MRKEEEELRYSRSRGKTRKNHLIYSGKRPHKAFLETAKAGKQVSRAFQQNNSRWDDPAGCLQQTHSQQLYKLPLLPTQRSIPQEKFPRPSTCSKIQLAGLVTSKPTSFIKMNRNREVSDPFLPAIARLRLEET